MNILQQGMYNIVLASGINTNTAYGIGIAAIVLILIVIFIKSRSNNNDEINNTASGSTNNVDDPALVAVITSAVMATMDNSELIAVITAAVMAEMADEAPVDGFVVRSIRRKNSRR